MKKLFFISSLLFSFSAVPNHLTLFFFPSPYDFSWKSPQKLARSVMKNTFYPTKFLLRHSLGHVSTEVKCDDGFHHLSGMTTALKNEDRDLLFKEKIGLGVMFYPMKGKLQDSSEVQKDLDDRYLKGKMNWLTHKISRKTCERLKKYIQSYKNENLDEVYGLVFNPRKKEGAGCSAFGISMLEVAGLMTDEFKTEFSHRLFINHNLDGFTKDGEKVSFFKILGGLGGSRKWAKNKDTGRELFFWRPNLMYNWAQNKIKIIRRRNLRNYKIETRGKTQGLVIDATRQPTPSEEIFL